MVHPVAACLFDSFFNRLYILCDCKYQMTMLFFGSGYHLTIVSIRNDMIRFKQDGDMHIAIVSCSLGFTGMIIRP